MELHAFFFFLHHLVASGRYPRPSSSSFELLPTAGYHHIPIVMETLEGLETLRKLTGNQQNIIN